MKKLISIFLACIMLISSMALLVACNDKERPNIWSPNNEQPVELPITPTGKLATPSGISLNGNILSWNAVESAYRYVWEIKRTDINTGITGASGFYLHPRTTFDLNSTSFGDGTYSFSVKATKGLIDDKDTDSDFSVPIEYMRTTFNGVKIYVLLSSSDNITNSMDGIYRVVSIIYNGVTYNLNDAQAMREYFRIYYIEQMKLMLWIYYPGLDTNNLEHYKILFSGALDFSNIKTVDDFWQAYFDRLGFDEMEDDFFSRMKSDYLIIAGHQMFFGDDFYGITDCYEFTLRDGEMVFNNPLPIEEDLSEMYEWFGLEFSVTIKVTYANGTITISSNSTLNGGPYHNYEESGSTIYERQ